MPFWLIFKICFFWAECENKPLSSFCDDSGHNRSEGSVRPELGENYAFGNIRVLRSFLMPFEPYWMVGMYMFIYRFLCGLQVWLARCGQNNMQISLGWCGQNMLVELPEASMSRWCLWGSKLPLCLKLVVVQGLDMEMTSAVVGDGTVLILGHCLAQGLDKEAVSAAVGESSLDILPVYGSGYG